jgi:hypothetical protein
MAGALDGGLDRLKIREPYEPEWRWCTITVVQLLLGDVVELDFRQLWHRPGSVLGDPRLTPYRLGPDPAA